MVETTIEEEADPVQAGVQTLHQDVAPQTVAVVDGDQTQVVITQVIAIVTAIVVAQIVVMEVMEAHLIATVILVNVITGLLDPEWNFRRNRNELLEYSEN